MIVGARCIVPKVNGNNIKTGRAQSIVPLQGNEYHYINL